MSDGSSEFIKAGASSAPAAPPAELGPEDSSQMSADQLYRHFLGGNNPALPDSLMYKMIVSGPDLAGLDKYPKEHRWRLDAYRQLATHFARKHRPDLDAYLKGPR